LSGNTNAQKKLALALSAISLSSLSLPVFAGNLVQNPNFNGTLVDGTTPVTESALWHGGNYGLPDQYNVLVPHWSTTSTISGISAPRTQGTTNLFAQGTYNSSNHNYGGVVAVYPVGGSITPPDGGWYMWQDAAQSNDPNPGYATQTEGAATQTLTGLIPGSKYTLSFDYAAGQLQRWNGATTTWWNVTIGGTIGTSLADKVQNATDSFSTTHVNNPSQGFTGWFSSTYTFTATNSSELIGFSADSNVFYNHNFASIPPVALLSNVQVQQVPFEFSPEQGFLLGVPLFLGLRRLKKRKLVK